MVSIQGFIDKDCILWFNFKMLLENIEDIPNDIVDHIDIKDVTSYKNFPYINYNAIFKLYKIISNESKLKIYDWIQHILVDIKNYSL